MQVKKQQLELDMEQWTDSKLGKEYIKGIYCHPACITYIQSTSCEMPGWMILQDGNKIARRNKNNLRYADDHPSGRKLRGIKEPLDESERGEWKSWLKAQNSKKKKIIASGSITSWQIDGETVADFIFLGSKITADGDCSHEI